MLDAGTPPILAGGAIVFRDHADPALCWVLPGPPRLVRDPSTGTPMLGLSWVRDPQGAASAGFFQAELELSLLPGQREQVLDRLLEEGIIDPVLAEPPWSEGRVSLSGWLSDGLSIAAAAARPSLLPGAHTLLSQRLDGPGALLLREALLADVLPAIVAFELSTPGLAGPLGIVIEADLEAVHERLVAQGALSTPWGRARISAAWEQMVEDRLIRVEVKDERGESGQARAEALRRMGEDLLAGLFTAMPPRTSGALLGNIGGGSIDLSFQLRMEKDIQGARSRWDFSERRSIPVHHRTALALCALLEPGEAAALIREVTAIPSGVEALRVLAIRPPSAHGLGKLRVELQWGPAPDAPDDALTTLSQEVLLDDAQPEQRLLLRAPGWSFRWRVEAFSASGSRLSAWQPGEGGVLVVDPAQVLPERQLELVAGPADWSWLSAVEARVQAPGLPVQTLVLDGPGAAPILRLPIPPETPLHIEARWLGKGEEPDRDAAPIETTDALCLLPCPFGPSLEVLLVPNPGANTESLVVELQHEQGGFSHQRTVELDGQTLGRALLRRLEGAPPRYRYRVSTVLRDGTVEQDPWKESEALAVVVGLPPALRGHPVQVVLPGGSPVEQGLLGMQLELTAGEEEPVQLLLQAEDQARAVLVLPAGTPLRWQARVQRYLSTGGVEEERVEGEGDLVVL